MCWNCLLRVRAVAAALSALALVAGCGQPSAREALAGYDSGNPAAEPVVSPVPTPTAEEVVLYFPHKSRPVLVREVRKVTRQGEQPEVVSFRELLRGPSAPAARPVALGAAGGAQPGEGSLQVLGSKVFDGNMMLLLSRTAADALIRSGDQFDVYAIVNTAAARPRVQTVRFTVEGHTGPLMVAGIDLTQPLAPRWDLVDTTAQAK